VVAAAVATTTATAATTAATTARNHIWNRQSALDCLAMILILSEFKMLPST